MYQTLFAIAVGVCLSTACRETERPKGDAVEDLMPWSDRTTSSQGFPCDVDEVLAQSCRRCHWDPTENEAPFGFHTWRALHRSHSDKPIHELMVAQIEANLMPPVDLHVKPKVQPLSAEQKRVLLDWLRSSAPKSDADCK